MGLDVRERTRTLDIALASEDLEVAAGVVKKGTVAGQRFRWSGLRGGEEVVISETVWRISRRRYVLDWTHSFPNGLAPFREPGGPTLPILDVQESGHPDYRRL
jgi:hypothetical protein